MEKRHPDTRVPLYEKLASDISRLIRNGTFRPGDRIPSVRQLSEERQVSITTVLQAYHQLENQGIIVARPQSGYFVRLRLHDLPPEPEVSSPQPDPTQVSVDQLVSMVLHDTQRPDMVRYSAAIPDPKLLPTARLNRILATIARRGDPRQFLATVPSGVEELRVQITQRAFMAGYDVNPDDILITAGCTEALSLCLRAVCKPGDTVAIESPTYFGILQAMESMGLRALEIPTHPQFGVSLGALRFAIEHQPVQACLIMTNFSNPLGCTIPDDTKRELVALLAEHDIPLIEDDMYSELYFNEPRPRVAKAFDRKGLVLLCSSFSKDLSPSYRVGWVLAGRFREDIIRLKIATSFGTAILPQLAIANFLESGGYDRHVRHIRRAYAQKVTEMAQDVMRFFPEGTRVSRPGGGFVIWVQMPEPVDSLTLYRASVQAGITVAPGQIFSATQKYRNFIRLNAAYYSPENSWALAKLGELACAQMGGSEKDAPKTEANNKK